MVSLSNHGRAKAICAISIACVLISIACVLTGNHMIGVGEDTYTGIYMLIC